MQKQIKWFQILSDRVEIKYSDGSSEHYSHSEWDINLSCSKAVCHVTLTASEDTTSGFIFPVRSFVFDMNQITDPNEPAS